MPEANTLLKDEKFYKKLNLFINSIHNDVVRLDIERKKYCVRVTQGVVETLIKRLKEEKSVVKQSRDISTDLVKEEKSVDKQSRDISTDLVKEESQVFSLFYQKISYVGSYFDGLRVSDATEFDLNIVLNLQFNYDKIKIENSKAFPGYVLLNVKNVELDEKKFTASILKEWKKWVDPDGYLLHDAVLRWWESIFAKISDKGRYLINYDGKFYEVCSRKNGPAITLNISNTADNLEIDVDLVPVLEFPSTRSPPPPTRWVSSGLSKKFVDDTNWAVVPKPMDDKRLWRLSFTAQEQKIMLDLRHLKYINKLLKKFRDANKLNIPSYQIKTFFIWEAFEKKKTSNEDFWKKPPSYLLAYMLVKLAEALEKKELQFFWNTDMNLFNLMIRKSPNLLPNMEGQVKRIITNLNKLIESGDTTELEIKLCSLFGVEVQRNGILKNSVEEHNGPVTDLESTVAEDSDILEEIIASSFSNSVPLDTVDSFMKTSITPKKKLPKVTNKYENEEKSPVKKDDATAKYCAYLVEKLNQFNPRTRSILINKINNLIFETEMDTYNSTTSTILNSDHSTCASLISFSSSPTLPTPTTLIDPIEMLRTLSID